MKETPKIEMTEVIFKLARSGNLPMDVEYTNPGFQNPKGQTILHIIAKRGCVEEVKYLFEQGCPLNLPDFHGTTPYDIARNRKHKALVWWFLKQDISISSHQRKKILLEMTRKMHEKLEYNEYWRALNLRIVNKHAVRCA